jgi:hypothetical protein
MVTAPVVDPLDEEKMGGLPVTRATSADGRWAYTLYDRAGKPPFVHALDTRGRTAKCIDLDLLGARRTDVYQLKLGVGPPSSGRLSVTAKGSPVALIDTRTFRVSAPGAGAPATRAHEDRHAPWALLAAIGGALLLAGGAGLSLTRRRRRLAPT